MADTLFKQTYDTVWAALDGDTDLSTFMGNGMKHKFSGPGDSAIVLRPSDCPALIMRPAGTGITIPDNSRQTYAFAIEFELATHQQTWHHIWEFLARVIGRLTILVYANCGLSYQRKWSFSAPAVKMGTLGKEGEEWAAWLCTFTLTLNIERDAKNGGLFTTD